MKYLVPIVLSVIAMPAFADDAESPITGNITFSSNYISRGLTNSSNNPAIQGGLTYTLPLTDTLSAYAGVWGSSVHFNDGSGANIEVDLTGGIVYSQDNFAIDTGLIVYKYPGIENGFTYNYHEFQVNGSYDLDPVTFRAAVNYSPEMAPHAGRAVYSKLALDYQAFENIKFTAHGGRQIVDKNANFGIPDYYDWGIGSTVSYAGLDFGAEYDQNDIGKPECNSSCGPMFMFTVSKSF